MKRSSSTYRLKMIKEAALRKQHQSQASGPDPMADYIHHLLVDKPLSDKKPEVKRNFSGTHFDEKIGGWVSDRWE